jgi:cytochrome oxidase assembly protein ShyY1
MTVFTVLMLPVVVSLGIWQLQRAALKHGYEARYFDRMAEAPRPMPQDLDDVEFLRVTLQGVYDPVRYFLVDNQIHEGRPGYWVIALFRADDGRTWLVNRGWVPAPALREDLPGVTIPADPVSIAGVLWPDTGLVPLLAEDPWGPEWPKRVQRLDVVRMTSTVGATAPVEVRLENGSPGVLVAAALGHDFKAQTHEGYAAQWFGLAAVLVVGYIVFGFRRNE